ncbi:MAG: DUF948 domain-containing protein [Deltaproteobacteria bacterium]|nr:DUF948 domain-containing protein [Deltaproteobacteria bacterium]
MTITIGVYEFAILIIALAFLILVITLIPTLLQLKKTIKAFEDLTEESKRTVETLNSIIKGAGAHSGDIEEVVKSVKDVVLRLTDLMAMLIDNVKSPLITIISLIFGVEQGFKRFFSRDKKGGGGDGN